MKTKRLPTTVQLEVVNPTAFQWMYLPWCGRYVPPDTRALVRMPVEWRPPMDETGR